LNDIYKLHLSSGADSVLPGHSRCVASGDGSHVLRFRILCSELDCYLVPGIEDMIPNRGLDTMRNLERRKKMHFEKKSSETSSNTTHSPKGICTLSVKHSGVQRVAYLGIGRRRVRKVASSLIGGTAQRPEGSIKILPAFIAEGERRVGVIPVR